MEVKGGIHQTFVTLLILLILLSYTLSYSAAISSDNHWHLDQINPEEFPPIKERSLNQITGLIEPIDWQENAPLDPCPVNRDIPSAFDWRDYGGDPPIRDQGACGSCWAFATTGALECNIKIKHNRSVDLSEQWLINCNQEGWGCDGGWYAHDYHMWKTDPCGDTGAVLENYCPYTALDDLCNCPYPHDYLINNWSYIGDGTSIPLVSSIKQAILDYGPVSVAIRTNLAFQQYTGGVFNSHSPLPVDHAVVLVGWNDTQGSNGVWILRNSWGPSWGENGYMRIEYGCSSVGYAACYIDYSPSILEFKLLTHLPEVLSPGDPSNFTIEISEIGDTLIPGSPTLHYRYNNGGYQTSSLISLGDNSYEAILPPAIFGDTPEYYISAQGVNSSTNTLPYNAPTEVFHSFVGYINTLFSEDFENETGWTVIDDLYLTDGSWERGMPVGGGDRGDPSTDYDKSGKCFLTDNVDGNSDVDGGTTWLYSPILDLSNGSLAVIHFAIWYTNYFGSDPHNDYFNVYVSNNSGSTWHLVHTIGPFSIAEWIRYGFVVNDIVTPSNQIQVMFEVSDLGLGSIVEAAVDDYAAYTLTAEQFIPITNLSTLWNLCSIPFNLSLPKQSIFIEFNGSVFSWIEAVQNNIIIDFVYGWNRSTQMSEIISTFHPGYSYWSFAYEPCRLICGNSENISNDIFITSVEDTWSLISIPNESIINKTHLQFFYENDWYNWTEAVQYGILLPFVYLWNNSLHSYEITDVFNPGSGAWIYTYYPCKLFMQEEI